MSFLKVLHTIETVYDGICTAETFLSSDKGGKVEIGANMANNFLQKNSDKIAQFVKNHKNGK